MSFRNTLTQHTLATCLVGGLVCLLAMGCGGESSDATNATVNTEKEGAPPPPELGPADAAQTPDEGPDVPVDPDAVDRDIWLTDFEEAKRRAAAEEKDLVISIVGTDWCEQCERLDNLVFSRRVFADFAEANFIPVRLDYPRDESKLPEAIRQQNAELRERFRIEKFPTTYLADAQGRLYAEVGHMVRSPEEFIDHMNALKNVRARRDEAFAAAESLSGVDKARKLDEGLRMLPPDLIFPSYNAEVDEIIALDADNEAGLQEEYQENVIFPQLVQAFQDVYSSFRKSNNVDDAMRQIENVEERFGASLPVRVEAAHVRMRILHIRGKTDEVIAVGDAILKEEGLEGDKRYSIYNAELALLNEASRPEEALKLTEAMVEDFKDDPEKKVQALLAQADFLSQLGRDDESRAALDAARKLTDDEHKLREIDQTEREYFPSKESTEDESDSPTESSPATPAADAEKPE